MLIFSIHLLRENILNAGLRIIVGTKFYILIPAHLCNSFAVVTPSQFAGCCCLRACLHSVWLWLLGSFSHLCGFVTVFVLAGPPSISFASFYFVPSVTCLTATSVALSAPSAVLFLFLILSGPCFSFLPFPSLLSKVSISFLLLNLCIWAYCKSTVSCVCRQKLIKVGWKYFQDLVSIWGMWPLYVYTY